MPTLPFEQIRPCEVPDQEGRVLFKKTRNHPVRLHQGLVMRSQNQILERIQFLQQQLESLDHYLPETYQFLMAELDLQQRDLMQLRIEDFYAQQNHDE